MFSRSSDFIHLHLRPYRLELASPWPGKGGRIHLRRGWIIELEQQPFRGFGDCAPLPEAGTETLPVAEEALSGMTGKHPSPEALNDLQTTLAMHAPAVACALDSALLDLKARQRGLPLRRLLEDDAADSIRVNTMAGAACREEATPLLQAGFRRIKLKVGRRPWQEEARCLQELATALPREVLLRLDANRAWDLTTARRFRDAIAGLPVEYLEEPLQSPTLAKLEILQRENAIPLAVDESLETLGREALLASPTVEWLVLKPMALGGLRNSLELARRATDAGMRAVITSSLESSVGLYAACQLAAAVDALSPGLRHGLATSGWFRTNPAPPPLLSGEWIDLPLTSGLGVTP